MRYLTTLLLSLFLSGSAIASTSCAKMPSSTGKDLNGTPWVVPEGLPGNETLILIGFDEPQQADIDTWTEELGLSSPSNHIPWIEMPLINNPGMFMRWFINTGMKGGIPSKEVRSHVWTAYTDKKAFMQSCGMPSEEVVYALVVNRKGKILAMEQGDFSKTAAARLMRFFHP